MTAMSARGLASPRPGSTKGWEPARIAELMRVADRTPASSKGFRSSSLSPALPLTFSQTGSCPSWNEAAVQMCVSSSVQAQIQPRLDGLAERLANIVASAQGELHELERLVERSEARVEGRLSSLEARVAVLVDGTARAEQRERDLNARIASVAEGLLRKTEEAEMETSRTTKIESADRRITELAARMESVEESSRKGCKGISRLEDKLQGLDERVRTSMHLADELRSQIDERCNAEVDRERGITNAKLASFEEQVCTLGHVVAEHSCKVSALEGHVETCCSKVESISSQFASRDTEIHKLLHEDDEQKDNIQRGIRSCSEKQQALAARVDDMNLRMGALKVKSDGVESRLSALGDRADSARKPLEAFVQQEVNDRCRKIAIDVDEKLGILEQRVDNLHENCEDVVECSLERRLAVLSGVTPRSRDRTRSSEHKSMSEYDEFKKTSPSSFARGTPSITSACGDLRHADRSPTSTPVFGSS